MKLFKDAANKGKEQVDLKDVQQQLKTTDELPEDRQVVSAVDDDKEVEKILSSMDISPMSFEEVEEDLKNLKPPKVEPPPTPAQEFEPSEVPKIKNRESIEGDVDYQFLKEVEESPNPEVALRGVVPKVGQSGTTVGMGVDLGQMNAWEINNRLDLPKELKQKLVPYALRKRDEAQQFLNDNPLTLTQDEVDQINQAAVKYHNRKVRSAFEDATGRETLPTMPRDLATVVSSATWNLGHNSNYSKKIYQALVSDSPREGVIDVLQEYADNTNVKGLKNRRMKEIDYLRGGNSGKAE